MNLNYMAGVLHLENRQNEQISAEAEHILKELNDIKDKYKLNDHEFYIVKEYMNVLEQYNNTTSWNLRRALAYASDYFISEIKKIAQDAELAIRYKAFL
ncbi:hypothetical protein ACU7RR_002345 [Providencia stuartii]|uniref:Uncharacterized protein n=1 Tax=Providencia stuartii (strain MRSN 2154) TaxID=1157951 RepID=A0A140NIU7_PROSM|nr:MULTISPECIES: hypothetical protein [Providencia]AFH91922.1 hypothetical protein S70_00085 [Providencia stuartii MRSN 2154]MDE8744692.1 hypothetical protein [Providencia thailandensis]MDE8765912.1 hypothetical protein [Providencia thailandensis]MDE8778354.1 hypothetical protein [Providencia thailandensis]MDE8782610.1 hypothetical protein [Providencia thailandensis]